MGTASGQGEGPRIHLVLGRWLCPRGGLLTVRCCLAVSQLFMPAGYICATIIKCHAVSATLGCGRPGGCLSDICLEVSKVCLALDWFAQLQGSAWGCKFQNISQGARAQDPSIGIFQCPLLTSPHWLGVLSCHRFWLSWHRVPIFPN